MQALEERGIGRPSTYASIMGTILDRGYVFKRGTALVPSFLAFAVITLLEQHFGQLVDYDFTARDGGRPRPHRRRRRGAGEVAAALLLRRRQPGLHALVTDQLDQIDARAVNTLPIGNGIALRVGRYGPYVERGEERASVPEDLAPDELTVEKAEELLAAPTGDRILGVHPDWGREIAARSGRYGPYVTEVLAEGASEKPRAASLFASMSPETVTLEEAVRLLSLPRVLGMRRRRRRDHRSERPLRAVRQEGNGLPLARARRSSSSRSRSTRRSSCSPSRSSAAGAARRSRR